MKDWISVDIETSGLDPCVHETIEVGMCWANGTTDAFSDSFDECRAFQEEACDILFQRHRKVRDLIAGPCGYKVVDEQRPFFSELEYAGLELVVHLQ